MPFLYKFGAIFVTTSHCINSLSAAAMLSFVIGKNIYKWCIYLEILNSLKLVKLLLHHRIYICADTFDQW